MKLSDVKGEKQFEILGKAIPMLEKLSKNKDFNNMLNVTVKTPEDKEAATEQLTENVKKHLPKLIQTAGKELAEYAALLKGEKPEDVSAGEIFLTLVEMLNDPVFFDFFALYRPKSAGKN